jgi:hypothetical protein
MRREKGEKNKKIKTAGRKQLRNTGTQKAKKNKSATKFQKNGIVLKVINLTSLLRTNAPAWITSGTSQRYKSAGYKKGEASRNTVVSKKGAKRLQKWG